MGWLSSVCSFVSNTVSNIGSAVSGFCTNVLPRLGPMIEKGLATLGPLGQIAQCVLQAFNIFKPQDKIEDMGDRALQAADKDIRPEKFDRFDNYLEYIRNMELDPEKSQKNTPEQKIVAGLAIGAKGWKKNLMPQKAAWATFGYWLPQSQHFLMRPGSNRSSRAARTLLR